MSVLHEAVARALRQEMWVVKVAGLSDAEAEHLARAVVGVVLAEATRSIEALPVKGQWAAERMQVEALAVLTALGEHA